MCAIIASKDPKTIIDLVEVNSYRGSFSWSITGITKEYFVVSQEKGFGEFPVEDFASLADSMVEELYWICHVQAPTNGLKEIYGRIHPAEHTHEYLWHNGIIKDKWVEEALVRFESDDKFDTSLLLSQISSGDFLAESLEDVDGSFACMYLKEGEYLKVFRNTASPLFCDGTNFSSVRFDEMEPIDANLIYDVDLDVFETQPEAVFTNINEPFFFGFQ